MSFVRWYAIDKFVRKLLDVQEEEKKLKSSHVLEASSTGPGMINVAAFIQGSENVFFKIKTTSGEKKKERPQIIICEFDVSEKVFCEEELLFFSLLIRYADVYFWQGSHDALAKSQPLTMTRFLLEREHIRFSSRAIIEEKLIEEGVDVKKFIIFDNSYYMRIMLDLSDYQIMIPLHYSDFLQRLDTKTELEINRFSKIIDTHSSNFLLTDVLVDDLRLIAKKLGGWLPFGLVFSYNPGFFERVGGDTRQHIKKIIRYLIKMKVSNLCVPVGLVGDFEKEARGSLYITAHLRETPFGNYQQERPKNAESLGGFDVDDAFNLSDYDDISEIPYRENGMLLIDYEKLDNDFLRLERVLASSPFFKAIVIKFNDSFNLMNEVESNLKDLKLIEILSNYKIRSLMLVSGVELGGAFDLALLTSLEEIDVRIQSDRFFIFLPPSIKRVKSSLPFEGSFTLAGSDCVSINAVMATVDGFEILPNLIFCRSEIREENLPKIKHVYALELSLTPGVKNWLDGELFQEITFPVLTSLFLNAMRYVVNRSDFSDQALHLRGVHFPTIKILEVILPSNLIALVKISMFESLESIVFAQIFSHGEQAEKRIHRRYIFEAMLHLSAFYYLNDGRESLTPVVSYHGCPQLKCVGDLRLDEENASVQHGRVATEAASSNHHPETNLFENDALIVTQMLGDYHNNNSVLALDGDTGPFHLRGERLSGKPLNFNVIFNRKQINHQVRSVFFSESLEKILTADRKYLVPIEARVCKGYKINHESDCVVTIKGFVSQGEAYVLPNLVPSNVNDFIILNASEGVRFYYERHQGIYYFSSEKSDAVDILCLYRKQEIKKYDFKSAQLVVDVSLIENVPHDFRFILEHYITLITKVEDVLEEKLDKIMRYFKGFSDEALNIRENLEDESALLEAILSEKKGVCRHRAFAFMLMVKMLGVKCRVVLNHVHAFCEVMCVGSHGVDFKRIDLGGGRAVLDEGARKRINNQQSLNDGIPLLANSLLYRNDSINVNDEKIEKYEKLIEKKVKLATIESINNFDFNQAERHLWLYSENENPLDIVLSLSISHRPQFNDSIFYVSSPSEFRRLLFPCGFEGVRKVQLESNFMRIVDEGANVLLIICWDSFTTHEKAVYKSVMDKKPNLLGISLPDNVFILGLMKERNLSTTCSSFLSRVQLSLLSVNAVTARIKDEIRFVDCKQLDSLGDIQIRANLNSETSWWEQLVGRYILNFEHSEFIEGPLLKAMRNGLPILIEIDKEGNEEVIDFIMRVLAEKKIYFNGRYVEAHPNFSVNFAKSTQSSTHSSKVTIISHELDVETVLDVSASEFSSLYESYVYNESGLVSMVGGILDKLASGSKLRLWGRISSSQWIKFLSVLEKKESEFTVAIMLAPGSSIEGVASNEELLRYDDTIFFSDDENEALSLSKKKCFPDLVLDVSEKTTLSDLMLKSKLRSSHVLEFDLVEGVLLQKLREGKRVLIKGGCSYQLFLELLPFMKKNQKYFFNGHVESLPGSVVFLLPETLKKEFSVSPLNASLICDVNEFMMELTRQLSAADYNDILFFKLRRYINLSCQVFDHKKDNRYFPLSPILFEQALKYLNDPVDSRIHRLNPLKGLFLNNYSGEIFCQLNVEAKRIFSESIQWPFRLLKLRKIVEYYQVNDKNIILHIYKILNCLDRESVEMFFSIQSQKNQLTYLNQILANTLRSQSNTVALRTSIDHLSPLASSSESKFLKNLKKILSSTPLKMLIVTGDSGVGKSHLIRHYAQFYEGAQVFQEVEAWLNAKVISAAPIILLLDEYNLHEDEHFSFLWSFGRGDGTVYWDGKLHKLTPFHRVVATGNPSYYPNRFSHRLFKHCSETLLMKLPSRAHLLKNILFPLLSDKVDVDVRMRISKALLAILEIYERFISPRKISVREFSSIALRCRIIMHDTNTLGYCPRLLCDVALGEFGFSFDNELKKEDFITKVCDYLQIYALSTDVFDDDDLMMCLGRAYFYPSRMRLIFCSLVDSIRLFRCSGAKLGVLLEGEAGLGKSTMLENVLKTLRYSRLEFSNDQPRLPGNYYYLISAGTENSEEVLLDAFHRGYVVIYDELNLDPDAERVLNQLLSGVDLQGRRPREKGFGVLASQNFSTELGRVGQSQALRSRFHLMRIDEYSEEEMVNLLSCYKLNDARERVVAFQNVRRRYPATGMRTFFKMIKDTSEAGASSAAASSSAVALTTSSVSVQL